MRRIELFDIYCVGRSSWKESLGEWRGLGDVSESRVLYDR